MRTGRAAWLILAVDGPATECRTASRRRPSASSPIPALPRRAARRTSEDRGLRAAAGGRGGTRDRRRGAPPAHGMRAVHLAPPDAVDDRLAALAAGFDDALATTTAAAELAGGSPGSRRPRATRPDPRSSCRRRRPGARPRGARAPPRRPGDPPAPKEFGLLALLAAHPGPGLHATGAAPPRLGSGARRRARTVDVHVRWLRSKIEPGPYRPACLVTVRGVGYRLDDRQRAAGDPALTAP